MRQQFTCMAIEGTFEYWVFCEETKKAKASTMHILNQVDFLFYISCLIINLQAHLQEQMASHDQPHNTATPRFYSLSPVTLILLLCLFDRKNLRNSNTSCILALKYLRIT